ncbi:MAG: pyridoxamine 5'-phosphate oxidase family protein [Lachnospiraceae bacterium]|nr:pyridoxamine 5'-phosphate oxidase family protein [Lachnospiraceae bacterium]
MQHRMKTHPLDTEKIESLLCKSQVATIATINNDGTPYTTPIHFVYQENAIYFHGLPKGQKIDNIRANPLVSLAVYEMDFLILDSDNRPCETNTKYQSVIITGKAYVLEDYHQKEATLELIVQKYTPQLSNVSLPKNMVKGTAVIKIEISELTGKYYE